MQRIINVLLRLSLATTSLLSLTIPSESFGQEAGIRSKELSWQTTRSHELHSKQFADRSCRIITRKDKSIDLICGSDSLSFSIDRISGTWTDHSKEGSLNYDVTYLEVPGKIIISRKGDEISVLIDFTKSEKQAMKRRFFISEVN